MSGNGQRSFKGKKILYVTSDWSGLQDLLTCEYSKPKGMPAFVRPIKALAMSGAEIELIVLSKNKAEGSVPCSYFDNTHITILRWPDRKSLDAIYFLAKSFWSIIKLVNSLKPDFIYAQGSKGVLGQIVARLFSIPVGVRVFGVNTYLYKYESLGRIKFSLKSPFLFLSFWLNSHFLLATKDGSPSDKLYNAIGNKKTKFLCWKNGFDQITELNSMDDVDSNYIFYPSRIADKKQQTKAVELLYHLKRAGVQKIKLIMAGQITEKKYFNKIFALAESLSVGEFVEYYGVMEQQKLLNYMHNAQAVVSFQKVSNLGNTLIEALSCESIVVSYNEKSLTDFLIDNESALLVDSMDEAATKLIKLMKDPVLTSNVRKNAKKALFVEFDSWEVRVEKELNLILDVL
jgi:glycosyltransferase involved in cell wall biosynthesis